MEDVIKNRIEALAPEYREFVLSDFAEVTVSTLGKPLVSSDDQLVAFKNGIMLWLLFFLSRDELVSFFVEECGVDPAVADLTVTSIIEGLPQDLVAAMKKTYLEINEGGGGEQPAAAPVTKENLLTDIAETQAQLDAIQPIRTMEGDAAAAHGDGGEGEQVHQSQQENIFGQRPVLGDTPSYQQPEQGPPQEQPSGPPAERPRWDSEQEGK